MRRYELFLRTRGCTYPFFFVVFFLIFTQTPIIIYGTIVNPAPMEHFLENSFTLTKILSLPPLLCIIVKWKYFLDLIFRSTAVFSGHLKLGSQMVLSKVEACDGRQWELFEATEASTSQKFRIFHCQPKKFRIFRDRMEQIYESKTLLSDICEGVVTFRYMKRSKYIVEIIQIERMVPYDE